MRKTKSRIGSMYPEAREAPASTHRGLHRALCPWSYFRLDQMSAVTVPHAHLQKLMPDSDAT